MNMDIDANLIIDKLGNTIKTLNLTIAIKDTQIEILTKEIAELKKQLEVKLES